MPLNVPYKAGGTQFPAFGVEVVTGVVKIAPGKGVVLGA
jgi:hypothetical protein